MQSESLDKKAYFPAFIGAGLCLLLLRTGLLSFFFLVPLGFVAYRYENKIALTASFFAILANGFILLGSGGSQGIPFAASAGNLLHFTAMVLVFTWITIPSPALAEKVSYTLRLVTGYSFGALAFIVYFLRIMDAPGFSEYVTQLLNTLAPQSARFELTNADMVFQLMKDVILRGGSLVTCVFLFTFSRQISLLLARIIPGKSRKSTEALGLYFQRINSLIAFRVNPTVIWVLSSSFLLIVLTRVTRLEIPEIILWNILILCAILYLAQGMGILQFFLSRPSISPFLKLLILVMLFVLFISPFLNGVLLIGLVLLGIAENWVPLRVPKQNSPPSTPEDEA